MDGADFLYKHRNRSLQLELSNKKRIISESRRELELMRKKSREMEALVSLVQRAWSQLDIDASLLLDSLGDPEAVISDQGANDMLYRFLHISNQYYQVDPTGEKVVPSLEGVDEWSSEQDISAAVASAEASIQSQAQAEGDMSMADAEALEEHLTGHVSFSMSLLERLCNAIADSGVLAAIPTQTQQNILQIKENYSKIMFLNDEIVKLRMEIVTLHARLAASEGLNSKLHKRLDKAMLTISNLEDVNNALHSNRETEGAQTNGVVHSSSSSGSQQAGSSSDSAKLYEHRISVLEGQLAESEAAKAAVEMRYTERISRPVAHSEVQVQDMRKAMEDLRAQCKQRVSSLIAENDSLQDKVRDLSLAMQSLEAASAAKVEALLQVTEAELAKYRTEKAALEAKLVRFSNDHAVLQQTQKSLNEYAALEEAKKAEISVLREQVKNMLSMNDQLKAHLNTSRSREYELESIVIREAMPLPAGVMVDIVKHANDDEHAGEHGEIMEHVHPNVTLLTNLHSQLAELGKELKEARGTINDLITEIDTMSTYTNAIHGQNESLNKQIIDTQSLQNAILEENITLQNNIEHSKKETKEMEAKMEVLRKLMLQQEGLLNQVRVEENAVTASLHGSQKAYQTVNSTRHQCEQQSADYKQQIADLEHQLTAANKKNEELTARCQDFTKAATKERKARQDAQRQAATRLPVKGGDLVATGNQVLMNQDDVDMLDMTLNMLKCSVCKDRFKSVAITRCYHLFCRECIEESLRNRSRKCPACGEKFGADDVANVFFTH